MSRDHFIFVEFPHSVLKFLFVQIDWKDFFLKKYFSRNRSFLHEYKTTNLGVIFHTRKLISYFSDVIIWF